MNPEDVDKIAGRIAVLEAQRRTNPKSFLGAKKKSGGPWSGAGITSARRLAAALASNPPGPFSTADEQRSWREALSRARELSNG